MPGDEYTSLPSTGKLKLKGLSDGRIDKKKKKKKSKSDETQSTGNGQDNSVVLKSLDHEARATAKPQRDNGTLDDDAEGSTNAAKDTGDVDGTDIRGQLQTEAERRFDEQRRKKMKERLQKEGVKTHKQKVEELNRYLSSLTDKNDLPKVGPG